MGVWGSKQHTMGARGNERHAASRVEAGQQERPGKVLQVVDVFDFEEHAANTSSLMKFSQFYNNSLSVYKTEWKVEYEKYDSCNDELTRSVADRFSGTRIETVLKATIDSTSNGGCIVVFAKVDGEERVEHVMLAAKKVDGARTILIITGSQTSWHSAVGWGVTLFTGGLLLAAAALSGPLPLTAAAIGIIGKIGVDHKMTQVDATKLVALKYLESRRLIKVDLKKGSIDLLF